MCAAISTSPSASRSAAGRSPTSYAASSTATGKSRACRSRKSLVAVGQNERDYLHIKNGAASAVTATIAPAVATIYQEGVGNVTVPSIQVTVAASGEEIVGPFPSAYIQADGTIGITWSSAASVTFAALRLNAVSKSYN
jgi:hypothetical protein